VNREAQSALLVLVGTAVLRITLDGTYLRYVKLGLWPFLVAAGAVLLVLGIAALADVFRRVPAMPDDHAHALGHAPRVAWLLTLPVFAIFLVAPPALGSYAASRDPGTVTAPTADSDFPPLPPGDPATLSLSDYAVRAVWDEGRTLKERDVQLTGFVTPGDEGEWFLTRVMLSCCAADGTAVKVRARGAEPLPADTWVRVIGRWAPRAEGRPEDRIPVLDVHGISEIEPPADPYE
jgi:uncharacterized repeat protein (TIGR03943 family)